MTESLIMTYRRPHFPDEPEQPTIRRLEIPFNPTTI